MTVEVPDGWSGLPPAALPWPTHVLVADTMFLARTAWYIADHPDQASDVEVALRPGRAFIYVGAHVPAEVIPAICRIRQAADPEPAVRAWESRLAPRLRVIDLPVGAHLAPSIAGVLRVDPDDIPTAALATFLAPAAVLSTDSVFANAGLPVSSNPREAVTAVGVASSHEQVAGASLQLAVAGSVGIGDLTSALATSARQRPVAALIIFGALAVTVALLERREPGNTRRGMRRAGEVIKAAGGALWEVIEVLQREHAEAVGLVRTIERSWEQPLDEAIAAILARCGKPMSVADLCEELVSSRPGYASPSRHEISVRGLTDALREHPAFTHSGRGWSLGRAVPAAAEHDPGPASALDAGELGP